VISQGFTVARIAADMRECGYQMTTV